MKQKEPSPVILPVRLDPALAAELDAVREGRNMSRNAFVTEALRAALGGQPDLKFRVAELALREFLIFVDAARQGGVFDHETARSLSRALQGARVGMGGKPDRKRPRGSATQRSPQGPHGLALAETERLREFVDRFRALCGQAGTDGKRELGAGLDES